MMLDPKKTYISISQTAGKAIRQLANEPMTWKPLRDVVIGSLNGSRIRNDSKELHFLADVTVGGVDMVLICCSAKSNKEDAGFTTIIRGAMSKERADRLDANGDQIRYEPGVMRGVK